MFYLVAMTYAPNTATTNRVMAYVKALSEMGISTRVVFFYPDRYKNKVRHSYNSIDFVYYWDRYYLDIPRLRLLSVRMYMKRFERDLKTGDKVFVYDFPDLIVDLSKREDIQAFEEVTEHPEIVFSNYINKTSLEAYLNACRSISGVFVISHGLKDYFVNKGCSESRVHIVNMIVDSSRFIGVNKRHGLNKTIAYCGTATNGKDGVDQLIKAFAIFVSKHPDYKLSIIGSIPSKHQRFENHELVERLGIEDKVVFYGEVSYTQIPQLLKDAEILALNRPDNTQAKYGFPTKLGEYLLTENPVVVTSVGDIPLFLRDMESALLSRADDIHCFADKLSWVAEHPTAAHVIAENGRKVAEKCFNYKLETQKIVNVIFPEAYNN